MSDLISREQLSKAMYHEAFETDSDFQKWDSGCWIRYKLFENVLESIPSAEKTGKWRHDKDDTLISGYCSECGWQSIILETDVADMPYCPNCGARMEAPQ